MWGCCLWPRLQNGLRVKKALQEKLSLMTSCQLLYWERGWTALQWSHEWLTWSDWQTDRARVRIFRDSWKVGRKDLIGAVFATASEKYYTDLTLTCATNVKALQLHHLEDATYKLWRQCGSRQVKALPLKMILYRRLRTTLNGAEIKTMTVLELTEDSF